MKKLRSVSARAFAIKFARENSFPRFITCEFPSLGEGGFYISHPLGPPLVHNVIGNSERAPRRALWAPARAGPHEPARASQLTLAGNFTAFQKLIVFTLVAMMFVYLVRLFTVLIR